MNHKNNIGFTLIELIIAVAIISLIVSLAYPSYAQHIVRSKVAEATTSLSELHLLSSQQYQDERTYISIGQQCVVAAPNSKYFTFSCSATTSTYTWTASNRTGIGLGDSGDYEFSIDHNGHKSTTRFAGTAVTKNCWLWANSSVCS